MDDIIMNIVKPYLTTNNNLRREDFNDLFEILSIEEKEALEKLLKNKRVEIVENENKDDIISSFKRPKNRLTNEEICRMYQNGDEGALELLVENNMKYIHSRALKFYNNYRDDLDVEDLFQFGAMGLMRAAKTFDESMGNKFITYATFWIDQRIRRGIMDTGFTIRVPVHKFEEVITINTQINRLKEIELDSEEIRARIKMDHDYNDDDLDEILEISNNILNPLSINATLDGETGLKILDVNIVHNPESIEGYLHDMFLEEALESAMEDLKEREKHILKLRYGFKDGEVKTLREIGELYGLSRERIRQIEESSFKKLRTKRNKNKLKGFGQKI